MKPLNNRTKDPDDWLVSIVSNQSIRDRLNRIKLELVEPKADGRKLIEPEPEQAVAPRKVIQINRTPNPSGVRRLRFERK